MVDVVVVLVVVRISFRCCPLGGVILIVTRVFTRSMMQLRLMIVPYYKMIKN